MNDKVISDKDFSSTQLERRSTTLSTMLKKCLVTLKGIKDEDLKLKLRKQINRCLIDAYNAGFIDSQNETKDSLRL